MTGKPRWYPTGEATWRGGASDRVAYAERLHDRRPHLCPSPALERLGRYYRVMARFA
jgi:hypothetical protein